VLRRERSFWIKKYYANSADRVRQDLIFLMIILGIDPGTATLGWGIIKKSQISNLPESYRNEAGKSQNFGVIRTSPKLSDSERLATISNELIEIIKKYQPERVAVEKIFFFKNQKTIITVTQARGVVLCECAKLGLEVFEYTPLEVKMAICSYGRADKEQVQKMVMLHLGLNEIPQPDDAADALAVAICCANSQTNSGIYD